MMAGQPRDAALYAVALFDSAPFGYLRLDLRGALLAANKTFRQWTGIEVVDLDGSRTLQSLLAPGGRIYLDTHVFPMLRMHGEIHQVALDIPAPAGSSTPTLLTAVVRKNSNGEPDWIEVTLFNASERRAYEKEILVEKQRAEKAAEELRQLNAALDEARTDLAARNQELARLNADKNRLLGMAAHDLRNPLGAIQVFSSVLLEEAKDALGADERESLQMINDSSEFMLKLVNDLLDVSKIESGKLDLECKPVDLAAVVRRNLAMNRLLSDRKNIHLEFEQTGELPLLVIDQAKIEQVLSNLVTNAIKFSHGGTTVRISLRREESEAILAVQDQGQGIPAGELSKLFQPFQSTSVRSTAGEPSTGLGLAIAKRIVTGHGGRVWVESQVGTGSTFFVALPLPGENG